MNKNNLENSKGKDFFGWVFFSNYLEIEGEEEDILFIAKELGFDLADNITKSYDGIYKEICKEKGVVPNPHIKVSN